MIKKQIFFCSFLYFLFLNIISFTMELTELPFNATDNVFQESIKTLHAKISSLDTRVLALEQLNDSSSSTHLQENNTNYDQPSYPWPTTEVATTLIDSVPEVKTIINRIERLQTLPGLNTPPLTHDDHDYRLLFTGKTGTGKTTLARAIATKLKRTPILLYPAIAGNEYQFCLQKYIKEKMCTALQSNDQVVVIIDEIDQVNGFHQDRLNPALVLAHYIDEAERQDRSGLIPRIIFVATAGSQDNIHCTLRSRLRHIEIGCPNDTLRTQILTASLEQNAFDTIDCRTSPFMRTLSKKTQGFSIRNLNELCNMAEEIAFSQSKDQEGVIVLRKKHMLEAFKKLWPKTIAAEKYWPYRVSRLIKWFLLSLKEKIQQRFCTARFYS